jgi:hypothetical protein
MMSRAEIGKRINIASFDALDKAFPLAFANKGFHESEI